MFLYFLLTSAFFLLSTSGASHISGFGHLFGLHHIADSGKMVIMPASGMLFGFLFAPTSTTDSYTGKNLQTFILNLHETIYLCFAEMAILPLLMILNYNV